MRERLASLDQSEGDPRQQIFNDLDRLIERRLVDPEVGESLRTQLEAAINGAPPEEIEDHHDAITERDANGVAYVVSSITVDSVRRTQRGFGRGNLNVEGTPEADIAGALAGVWGGFAVASLPGAVIGGIVSAGVQSAAHLYLPFRRR